MKGARGLVVARGATRQEGGLPRPLQAYLASVVGASLLVGGVLVAALPVAGTDVPLSLLFLGLLVLAQRYEIHLAPKTKVSVDTAVLFAAALLFPPNVALLLAGAGASLSDLLARRRWYNVAFNAAQVGLTTGLASLLYRLVSPDPVWQGGTLAWHAIGVVVAAAAMYLGNAVLVDVAVALQLGQRPLVGWWLRHRVDVPHHVALFLLGTLPALTARDHPWTVALLAVPVGIVHVALRDMVRLRRQTREAVEALADLVDLRDPYTHGHSQRVAYYSGLLAERLGLPPEEVELVRTAARVHDIGKIAVSDRVLLKPGRLDEAEWREMQRHPEVGAEILARFPDFRAGQEYVRAHHERPDGRGYARGLRAGQIPLGAAIIAVADSFDAMTSDRPYRAALPLEVALEEFRRHRGTQWDARVVDALFDLVAEGVDLPIVERLATASA